ncbi:hypothetical protein PspLS_11855 [Pyricularia sp. CBS 133598]|nr:hypothetical protein PspLS_11855 [Pyricularia sp. CBS 133598]
MQFANIVKVIAVTAWGAHALALPLSVGSLNDNTALNRRGDSGHKASTSKSQLTEDGDSRAKNSGRSGWHERPNQQSIDNAEAPVQRKGRDRPRYSRKAYHNAHPNGSEDKTTE